MGLAALKTQRFNSAEALCAFVNDKGISVIEIITIRDDMYILFYRQEIGE